MADPTYERGIEIQRELGLWVEGAASNPVHDDFSKFGTRFAFGEVWSRPGLDLRTRSCITIAILTALVRPEYLAMHLKAGLRNGLSPDEMREVIFHTAVYAGITAGAQAMRVADEVLGASSSTKQEQE